MKFNLKSLAIVLVGMSLSTKAQEWKKLISEGAPYSQVVSTFEKEWGDKPYERHQGFKPYYRYREFWKTRLNRKGEIPSKASINQAQMKYMASFPPVITGNEDDGFWRSEGPYNHVNTASWSSGQGRVNAIEVDPNNPEIIYVGAPDGGLWKSENGGNDWSSLIDDFSRLGVSDIAIDPNNSQVIYIATGDADGGDAPSIGVWKSVNGGLNWAQSGNITSNRIYKIEIDPDNSDRVIAATSTGLFRTTDAGITWSNVNSGSARDIQFGKGIGNTNVFAVTGSEFVRSTDDGASWTTISNGIPTDFDYMRLDVTSDDSTYVYIVGTGSGTPESTDYAGIYKSTDEGLSFTQVHAPATQDIFDGSGQAYYDLDLAVDQNDKDVLVVGVLNVWKSEDGGVSWNAINSWSNPSGASYTHADIHFLKWFGNDLYCGSDGGIYKSIDDGVNFEDLTSGLPIGQYYDIDVFQNDPSYMAGGLQDNGGYYFDGIWKNYYGADGMVNVINQKDSTKIFGMIQNGNLEYSDEAGLNTTGLGSPIGENGIWVTPMEWDNENDRVVVGYEKIHTIDGIGTWQEFSSFIFPQNVNKLELFNNKTNTILASTSSSGIFLTTDAGVTWTDIATNLPTPAATIKDIEFDDSDSTHIFVVQSFNVYETTNSGTTWTNITGNLPFTIFNDIEMDPSETNNSLYIATDVAVHYFNTTLGDWIPFNDNLPNVVVQDIEILADFNAIRIGTYGRGIFASKLYEKDIHTNDAQILGSSIMIDTLCSSGLIPVNIDFKNRAWDTIMSVDYEVLIDGVSVINSTWNGQVFPFQTENINAGMTSITAGEHDLTYILSQPNGNTDSYLTNDTLTFSVFVETGGASNTVELEINHDFNPTNFSWEIVNDENVVVETSNGGYPFSVANSTVKERLCLDDDCFVLKVNGNFFNGSYKLINSSGVVLVDQIGNFGSSVEHDFCLPLGTEEPIALFTVSDTASCNGGSVQFTDTSENIPTSWSWTFSGGTPSNSTLQNPLVTYSNIGSYDVQLIVENVNGIDTILKTAYIDVLEGFEHNLESITDPGTNCQDSIINKITVTDPANPVNVVWQDLAGNILSTLDSFIAYAPGDYMYTATHAVSGCEETDTFTLVFSNMNLTSNIVHSQCQGFDNGSINASVTGGDMPYTITWSDPDLTDLFETDLAAGDYILTVTDDKGCSVSDTFLIENQLVYDLDIIVLNHATCFEGSDASVTANISGGQPPYSYEWSMDPLNDVDTIGNVTAGIHTVKITDNNGCFIEEEFTVNDGYQPSVQVSKQDEFCENGNDGSISVIVSGGVPPFTFGWSHGLPNSPNVNNLADGNYTLLVTDANGCEKEEFIEINTIHKFEVNYTVKKESCDEDFDGAITANVSGGVAPYTLEWLNTPGISNTNFVDSLTTGDYYLSITGANGCQRTDTVHVGIISPIIPQFTVSNPFEYLDENPTFSFQNTSIGGSSYSWNFGDGSFSTLSSPEHTYTTSGTFFVKLTVFQGYCSREFTMQINVYPHVGIEDIDESASFDILPNPNNGSFNVTLNTTSFESPSVKVFDIVGREIVSKPIKEESTSIDNLISGSYIVKLYNNDQFIGLKKMVVR